MGNPISQVDISKEAQSSTIANHQLQLETVKALDLGNWDVQFSLLSVSWSLGVLSINWLTHTRIFDGR